jgi:hypothetical protein
MSGPARWDAEERESRAGLLRLVAMIEIRLVQGASACETLERLQEETAALLAVVHAARQADAAAWFAKQMQQPPKKPRQMNPERLHRKELRRALGIE